MIFRLGAKMTLQELNEHFDHVKELHKAESLLESLRMAAYPQSGISGMPKSRGPKDKVCDLALEITETSEYIDRLKTIVNAGEKKVASFINTVPDYQTRLILKLRYIRCFRWCEIAEIIGGGNTESSVSMIVYRYIGNL